MLVSKGHLAAVQSGRPKAITTGFGIEQVNGCKIALYASKKSNSYFVFELHYIIHSNVKSCECWN